MIGANFSGGGGGSINCNSSIQNENVKSSDRGRDFNLPVSKFLIVSRVDIAINLHFSVP